MANEISTYKTFLMLGTETTTYKASSDTSVVANKTYYTRTGTSPNYVYTPVAQPTGNPSTSSYYEVDETTITYAKLIDIKEFPDLGGAPEMLEITTLSDDMQRYIPGIQSLDALEFTANYTVADFTALKAIERVEKHFAVWFGGSGSGSSVTPTGSEGKFTFDGQLSVYPVGGGVNEVVDMNISIAPSTVIDFSAS